MFPSSTTAGSTSPLDSPPPSPQSMGASPTGAPTDFSLSAVAPPLPSAQMPPEILTAILQSAENIGTLLDSYAQALPDKAADFASVKDHLQSVLAQLMIAGAGATSPTATGSQFPGGGFNRGVAGAGAI
jgi:hypothetical protein